MATEEVKWSFKLVDNVSGAARGVSSGFGEIVQSVHSALAVLEYAARGFQAAGRLMGSALEPAMFRETTLLGLETLLGDTEKASAMYKEAVKFAAATPFETRQVVDSYQKLLVAGFKTEEIPIVLKGIGDLASLKGFNQEVIDQVTLAFGQIKSKGRLMGNEMMQLAEAGVPQGAVYERLGKIYGVTAEQAIKMQEAGKISADAGIFAVMSTLKDITSGGKLGNNMAKTAKSMTGLVSTLKSRPFEFLQELGETKGYDVLRESLGKLTAEFDPASETGGRLLGVIKDFGGGFLERAAVLLDYVTEGTGAFIEGLVAGLGPMDASFGPANQTNMEKFKIVMEGIGTGVATLTKAFGWLSDKIGVVWDYFTKIGEWWAKNEGMQAFLDKWVSPMFNPEMSQNTPRNALAGARGYVPPESSSEYERRLSGNVPGGYAQVTVPAMASGGMVTEPTLALIGEAGPEEVRPVGSGGGGPAISVSFVYQGTGSRNEAEDIERKVEAGVRSALDRWALQSGRRALASAG